MKVTEDGVVVVVGDGGVALAPDAPDGLGGEEEGGVAAHQQGVRGRRKAQ